MGEEVLEGSGSLAGRGEHGRGLPLGRGQRWGQSVVAWRLWVLTQQLLSVPAPFPSGMLPDAAPDLRGLSSPAWGRRLVGKPSQGAAGEATLMRCWRQTPTGCPKGPGLVGGCVWVGSVLG